MTDDDTDEYNDARKHPIVTEGDFGMWTDEDYFEDKAYPAQSRSQQQEALRNRLYNALLDLQLVFEHMPVEERRRVYGRLSSRQPGDDVNVFERSQEETELGLRALSAVVAITYEAAFENGVPFELVLEQGVRRAVEQNMVDAPPGSMISISVGNVEIGITQPNRDSVRSAFNSLQQGASIEDLTTGEQANLLRWYSRADEFDPEIAHEEFEEMWNSMLEAGKQRAVQNDDTES